MSVCKSPGLTTLLLAIGMGLPTFAAADGEVLYNVGGSPTSSTILFDAARDRLDLVGSLLILDSGDSTGLTPSVWSDGAGRLDMGWGGGGGGNLEAYGKAHASRPGQFKFIYGGGDFGRIAFTHYNGTNWLDNMRLDKDGNLYVFGAVNTSRAIVDVQDPNTWPDYVFEDDYQLMPLRQLDAFIQENGHLPGVPTRDEVMQRGLDLGEVSARLLEKVEELTLHMIALQKENAELAAKVAKLQEKTGR